MNYPKEPKLNSLRIGVLLIPPVQLLDACSIDVFGMLSTEYLEACGLPKPLLDLGIPVSIHYIAASGPDTYALMTAGASLPITDSLSSPAVQPGQLDTLLIPGPDPSIVPEEPVLEFIRAHHNSGTTDVLVVCTGIFPAGHAEILKGKRVSGPRGLIPRCKKMFPDTKFVERRWERDGRLWTSGGITNGLDQTAAYLHERFNPELADLVCAMAEIGDRGQDYSSGKTTNFLWWLWLILRSVVKGKTAGKEADKKPS